RMDRTRARLLLWILPIYVFLQFGTMSLSHYKHVSQEPRYITPVLAPVVLWAASVGVQFARGAWVEHLAPAVRWALVLVLGGVLLVHSWRLVGAEEERSEVVADAYEHATRLLEAEPRTPIFFDHWRTGLAFSYYFDFRQGSQFYRGANDTTRI